ncbi:MAG: Ppx/GppA phosphatase family protein [Candidatus Gracilibacteria bacterium]|nr:Ppx/GppA phosphatase family protein [Candidatus Gracilibacteria bacterium]
MQNKTLAAIDIGTNSFHLAIASVNDKGIIKVLTKDKEVVRLGKSSTDMKYISLDAMERAITVLKRFKITCDSFNAEIRAVAACATREALNKDEFINEAFRRTGISIEVISGYEEARLIYLGVLQALDVYNRKILLIDIGGGSTEFLTGEKGNVKFSNSIKLGAVRLTEKFFSDGKFTKENIGNARLHVRSIINPIVRSLKKENYDLVVGTSGTITNLGSIIYCKSTTEDVSLFNFNNYKYSDAELSYAVKTILSFDNAAAIKKIEGLDSDRADIITAGAIILEQIFKEVNIKQITLSSYALREGILFDTIDKEHNTLQSEDMKNVRYRSVINLGRHCGFDEAHCRKILQLSLPIYNALRDKFGLTDQDLDLLEASIYLHDIGHSISHSQHHRHSYYLIKNSELLGFNNEEIEIIANIARYHRKSHPKTKHIEFNKLSPANKSKVKMLSGILRIADGLDRGHSSAIDSIKVTVQDKNFHVKVAPREGKDPTLELWGANMRKELFEEAFGYNILIN